MKNLLVEYLDKLHENKQGRGEGNNYFFNLSGFKKFIILHTSGLPEVCIVVFKSGEYKICIDEKTVEDEKNPNWLTTIKLK